MILRRSACLNRRREGLLRILLRRQLALVRYGRGLVRASVLGYLVGTCLLRDLIGTGLLRYLIRASVLRYLIGLGNATGRELFVVYARSIEVSLGYGLLPDLVSAGGRDDRKGQQSESVDQN